MLGFRCDGSDLPLREERVEDLLASQSEVEAAVSLAQGPKSSKPSLTLFGCRKGLRAPACAESLFPTSASHKPHHHFGSSFVTCTHTAVKAFSAVSTKCDADSHGHPHLELLSRPAIVKHPRPSSVGPQRHARNASTSCTKQRSSERTSRSFGGGGFLGSRKTLFFSMKPLFSKFLRRKKQEALVSYSPTLVQFQLQVPLPQDVKLVICSRPQSWRQCRRKRRHRRPWSRSRWWTHSPWLARERHVHPTSSTSRFRLCSEATSQPIGRCDDMCSYRLVLL